MSCMLCESHDQHITGIQSINKESRMVGKRRAHSCTPKSMQKAGTGGSAYDGVGDGRRTSKGHIVWNWEEGGLSDIYPYMLC